MKLMLSLALLASAVAPVCSPLFGDEASAVVNMPKVSVPTWVPVRKIGEYPMIERRYGAAIAAVGGKLYIFGGTDGGASFSDTIECFDPATNTSRIVGRMRQARFLHGAAAVGTRIVVMGGYNGHTDFDKLDGMPPWQMDGSVEIFDPSTGRCTPGPDLPEPRVDFACVSDGRLVYVIGGAVFQKSLVPPQSTGSLANPKDRMKFLEVSTSAVTRTMIAFDTETMRWLEMPPMPSLRTCKAAWVPGEYIVVAGGANGSRSSAQVEAFNTRTKTWHLQPQLSEPVVPASVVFVGEHLLALGDRASPGRLTAYDLKGKYTEQFGLYYTPCLFGAALALDGKVYVAGGKRFGTSPSLAVVQILEYVPPPKALE